MRSVEHPVVVKHAIAALAKFADDFFEKLLVSADGEPSHVLEYEIRRLQLDYEAHEMMDQGISRIVQRPLADHAKALAGRAAENDIHGLIGYAGMVANVLAVNVGHAAADSRAFGKIKLVGRAMDGVVFDGGGNVESGLLEA